MVVWIAVLFITFIKYQLTIQFYLQNNDIAADEPTKVIENFQIYSVEESLTTLFPTAFSIEFTTILNETSTLRFEKLIRGSKNYPVKSSDIYVIDRQSGKVVRYSLGIRRAEDSEFYIGQDSKSVATLIKNSIVNTSDNFDFYHKFRMIGTLYDNKNNLYELIPTNHEREKRSTYDSNKNYHLLIVRNKTSPITDYQKIHSDKDLEEQIFNAVKSSKKQPRQINRSGKPLELFVELLLVTDRSVFEDHKRFARTNDNNLAFIHMRTYFSHFVNGVNQRFQNSFANDPDLRIYIKLKNLLFLTTDFDSNWTNSEYVGLSTIKQHKGRVVLLTEETLESFKNFMNSRQFPFTFDHALGLFNKDLWTKSGTNAEERSSVVGFSYQSKICSDHKYAIAEEIGGFLYMSIAAHEIGHNLGLGHDGDMDRTLIDCSPQDNYIMTPTIGFNTKNLTNQLKFSNCSINLLKMILLSPDSEGVSPAGECLINVPDEDEFEEVEDALGLDHPGLIWSPDDQCKMIYGQNASFCHFLKNQMCTSLACRISSNEPGCVYLSGNGAISGTICGSEKICLNGECVDHWRAPKEECPFGDDVIINLQLIKDPLPYNQMTCEEAFIHLTSINQFPLIYCTFKNFRETCCNTCRKYQGMTCIDKHPNCPQYKSLCTTSALFNSEPLKKVCARTCGYCSKETIFCQDSSFNCKNGGRCVNLTDYNQDDFIGYKCDCPTGFSGYLCEIRNPCEPSPCGMKEKCLRIGSLGHKCVCDSDKPTNDCPVKSEFSVMLNTSRSGRRPFPSRDFYCILIVMFLFIDF